MRDGLAPRGLAKRAAESGILDELRQTSRKRAGVGGRHHPGGLAVPHAKVDFIEQMCIVACSVKRGIDFDAMDKEPVYLLFLIVSPSNDTGPHIRALSAISRILSDADIRKNLIMAETPAEFYATLKNGESKYS